MKIKQGYKIREIAGEHVIVQIGKLNVNLTKVISLNDTSVWLWEQLGNSEFSAEQVADLLTEHYAVERDTALSDAGKWIEQLSNAGLLEE